MSSILCKAIRKDLLNSLTASRGRLLQDVVAAVLLRTPRDSVGAPRNWASSNIALLLHPFTQLRPTSVVGE